MTKPCQCNACKAKAAAHVTHDSVSASGFFTAEQLGEHQSVTPEGYLLCESVPIARTGTQDYLEIELPGIEGKDGVIVVERGADVVFSPETIASFNGKPVVIDHPSDGVTPANWSVLAKGTTHNVRRGEGGQSDLLLADLLITDLGAINEVRNKQITQISCGYDADYQQIAPGRARQVSVVGNHTALVKNARCGPVCSIGDSDPSHLKGATDMAKSTTKKPGALERLRKAFMTRDADEFEKATQEMGTGDEDEGGEGEQHIHIHMPGAAEAKPAGTVDDTPPVKPEDDPDKKLSEVLTKFDQRLTSIEGAIAELKAGRTNDDDPDAPPVDPASTEDDNPDGEGANGTPTGDSAKLRDEFQQAKALAEILAPGLKQPTYDSKTTVKKTQDAMCVLRRRALKAALDGEHAELVKSVTGDADVSKMPCGIAAMAFQAAATLVKQANTRVADRAAPTSQHQDQTVDLNKVHQEFWSKRM